MLLCMYCYSKRCRYWSPYPCTAIQQAPHAAPMLPCTSNQTALGGYSPVTDAQETSSLSQDVAPVAWQAFTSKNALTKCAASTVNTLSYNVTEACKQVGGGHAACLQSLGCCPHHASPVQGVTQVVAGTNIALQFFAYYDCTTASNAPSFGSVGLNAIVFEPLPTQGTNSQYQVSKRSRHTDRMRVTLPCWC